MKERAKFAVVSGAEYNESMVRVDYNTAKATGNVRYGKYFIFFQGIKEWIYVYYKDIIWAYHKLGDASRVLRRGMEGEIHSIMLVTKDKKRIGIPVGSIEDVVEGLNIIQKNNAFVDIGFSKEKEGKYL
ncbi:MAG: hypothetical protein GX235_10885 [Clostridiales bacterium]|nr:hypothetical protein [Clostridiales bacterium]